MKLSNDQIKMLAEQQREMDAGNVPFAILNGNRLASTAEIMTELGLEQGQTIDMVIFGAMLEASLASIHAKIALEEIKDSAK